jgi:hypothetical protein
MNITFSSALKKYVNQAGEKRTALLQIGTLESAEFKGSVEIELEKPKSEFGAFIK